jgi:hypothetical protein
MTKKVGSLDSHGAPVIRREVVANSITIAELDSVKLASGFVALGTAGALVFGHALSLSTRNQVGLLTTGVAGAEMGSYVGTYLTASDNQTVGFVTADCDISKTSLYSITPDAAIGTTTGSNLVGYKTDIADEDNIDEDTAHATTSSQYFVWGVDPELTSNGVYSIYESQVFGV